MTVAADGIDPARAQRERKAGSAEATGSAVESAIARSREYLLSKQHPDGYWCGELEADSMLEADYIYLHVLLGSGEPLRLRGASIRGGRATSRWQSNVTSPAN
jgi:squalene-hopene/tetraprenyl-beta-curcumene cyclase